MLETEGLMSCWRKRVPKCALMQNCPLNFFKRRICPNCSRNRNSRQMVQREENMHVFADNSFHHPIVDLGQRWAYIGRSWDSGSDTVCKKTPLSRERNKNVNRSKKDGIGNIIGGDTILISRAIIRKCAVLSCIRNNTADNGSSATDFSITLLRETT